MFHPLTQHIITHALRHASTHPETGGRRDHQALSVAVSNGHPLLVAMDALLAAAETYHNTYGRPLASDAYGTEWLAAAKGVRALLNLDLGLIHNATVESIFWKACEIAGFDEDIVERAA